MRRRQQAIHVGADGEEGDIAQIEQARIAHHNVQANRQQDIEQGHVGNAHPCIAKLLKHQRQDQQRNTYGQNFEIF